MKIPAIFTILALYLGYSNAQTSPIVGVQQGYVQGIKENSLNGNEFYSFMSIPYAEPPVGKLRFKDPVPIQPWTDTIDGSKMPEYCLQFILFDVILGDKSNITLVGKEDCLYLNVFTPKPNDETANLPVMVYIHGGGFFSGGAVEVPPYALMDKQIVLVVLQYRLGVLGFLSTEDSVLPGNYGLKDQQLALRWVKENIAHFGGDPNRITLFGESAGGASVHMHMLSPGSRGLFQRIIAQSGTALCPWATSEHHRNFATDLGNTFKCPLGADTEAYLQCLQTIHEKFLVQYMFKQIVFGLTPVYTLPRIDGEFFPDNFEVLLKQKNYNKVDIISGVTKDEGAIVYYLMLINPEMVEQLNKEFDVFGPISLAMYEDNAEPLATKVYKYYLQRKIINNINLNKDADQLVKLYTDRFFGVCHDISTYFHASDEDISVYRYQLDYQSPQKSFANLIQSPLKNDWVSHIDDLFHIFSGPPLFLEPEVPDVNDVKMRDVILTAWTNFAATGNPVSATSPEFIWEKATTSNFNHLSLQPNPRMEMFNKSESRKFWLTLNTEQNLKFFSDGTPGLQDLWSSDPKQEL